MSEFNSDAIEERGKEKAPQPPKGGGKGGRGNADWQSAQYKESNGGKNATEQNNKDGEAVQTNRHTMPDNKRNRRRREGEKTAA